MVTGHGQRQFAERSAPHPRRASGELGLVFLEAGVLRREWSPATLSSATVRGGLGRGWSSAID